MKRDFEVIREILNEVAELPHGEYLHINSEEHERSHNAWLLYDAGMIDRNRYFAYTDGSSDIHRLTWEGEELRDMLLNDGVWHEIKRRILELGGGAAVELVKHWAIELAKNPPSS